jgi:hypothetical protein
LVVTFSMKQSSITPEDEMFWIREVTAVPSGAVQPMNPDLRIEVGIVTLPSGSLAFCKPITTSLAWVDLPVQPM